MALKFDTTAEGGGADGVSALQTSQLPVPAQPGRGRPGRTPPPPRRLLLLRRLLRPLLPDVRERLLPPVLGRLRLHLLHPLPPAVGQLRLLLQRRTAAGDVGGVRSCDGAGTSRLAEPNHTEPGRDSSQVHRFDERTCGTNSAQPFGRHLQL